MNYVRHDEKTGHKVYENDKRTQYCYDIIMLGCFFIAKTTDCIFPDCPNFTPHRRDNLLHPYFQRFAVEELHQKLFQLF